MLAVTSGLAAPLMDTIQYCCHYRYYCIRERLILWNSSLTLFYSRYTLCITALENTFYKTCYTVYNTSIIVVTVKHLWYLTISTVSCTLSSYIHFLEFYISLELNQYETHLCPGMKVLQQPTFCSTKVMDLFVLQLWSDSHFN